MRQGHVAGRDFLPWCHIFSDLIANFRLKSACAPLTIILENKLRGQIHSSQQRDFVLDRLLDVWALFFKQFVMNLQLLGLPRDSVWSSASFFAPAVQFHQPSAHCSSPSGHNTNKLLSLSCIPSRISLPSGDVPSAQMQASNEKTVTYDDHGWTGLKNAG